MFLVAYMSIKYNFDRVIVNYMFTYVPENIKSFIMPNLWVQS